MVPSETLERPHPGEATDGSRRTKRKRHCPVALPCHRSRWSDHDLSEFRRAPLLPAAATDSNHCGDRPLRRELDLALTPDPTALDSRSLLVGRRRPGSRPGSAVHPLRRSGRSLLLSIHCSSSSTTETERNQSHASRFDSLDREAPERPGRPEALAPRPARGAGGFAGLAAVLPGHRRGVGRTADLRPDLGDHRRAGAAVPGRLLRDDQRAGRRAGARAARRDAAARPGRPGGRLSAPAGRHLPDGPGAGRPGQVQAGPLRRDLPGLGRRGDARGDRALDHRQATAADLRQSGNKFEAHEFWGIVREAPSQFMRDGPEGLLRWGSSAWR